MRRPMAHVAHAQLDPVQPCPMTSTWTELLSLVKVRVEKVDILSFSFVVVCRFNLLLPIHNAAS